jgi:hypothetical protein
MLTRLGADSCWQQRQEQAQSLAPAAQAAMQAYWGGRTASSLDLASNSVMLDINDNDSNGVSTQQQPGSVPQALREGTVACGHGEVADRVQESRAAARLFEWTLHGNQSITQVSFSRFTDSD